MYCGTDTGKTGVKTRPDTPDTRYPGLFTGHDPPRGTGQEVFSISWVRPDWIGSEGLQTLTRRIGVRLGDPTREV